MEGAEESKARSPLAKKSPLNIFFFEKTGRRACTLNRARSESAATPTKGEASTPSGRSSLWGGAPRRGAGLARPPVHDSARATRSFRQGAAKGGRGRSSCEEHPEGVPSFCWLFAQK